MNFCKFYKPLKNVFLRCTELGLLVTFNPIQKKKYYIEHF